MKSGKWRFRWFLLFSIFDFNKFYAQVTFLTFFSKFPDKISKISLKSKKISSWYSNYFEITMLIKIWPKYSLKTPKSASLPIKTFIFQNFRRLRRQRCGALVPFPTEFLWSCPPPLLGRGPPKKPLIKTMFMQKGVFTCQRCKKLTLNYFVFGVSWTHGVFIWIIIIYRSQNGLNGGNE